MQFNPEYLKTILQKIILKKATVKNYIQFCFCWSVWFMVFYATTIFQLYHGGQLYWWRSTCRKPL